MHSFTYFPNGYQILPVPLWFCTLANMWGAYDLWHQAYSGFFRYPKLHLLRSASANRPVGMWLASLGISCWLVHLQILTTTSYQIDLNTHLTRENIYIVLWSNKSLVKPLLVWYCILFHLVHLYTGQFWIVLPNFAKINLGIRIS